MRRSTSTLVALAAAAAATTLPTAAAMVDASTLPFFPGVHDKGIVLQSGPSSPCPGDCDVLGARDTWVFHDPTDSQYPFKMYYDGSGPQGWLASLAVTSDPTLETWTKKGTVLPMGAPGEVDSASASYLTSLYVEETDSWVGYYLGTNQSSPPPGRVPIGPYFSMLATSPSAAGPWTKYESFGNVIPSGSPGVVMKSPNDPTLWWQFCTGCAGASIGLVSTRNLTGPSWDPVVGLISDPVENTSLYFEESSGLWFLFTNHIGPDATGVMFDDSIWVYWSANLTSWPAHQVAVVLNRTNVVEPSFQVGRVGLPSVMRVPGNDKQLAMIYDGGGSRGNVWYNQNCSVALAWLDLPLTPPTPTAKVVSAVEEGKEKKVAAKKRRE
jgi:hypothetical protein